MSYLVESFLNKVRVETGLKIWLISEELIYLGDRLHTTDSELRDLKVLWNLVKERSDVEEFKTSLADIIVKKSKQLELQKAIRSNLEAFKNEAIQLDDSEE